jgi:hypothetical protein
MAPLAPKLHNGSEKGSMNSLNNTQVFLVGDYTNVERPKSSHPSRVSVLNSDKISQLMLPN